MQKVGFYTLGCKLNFSESSFLGKQFEANGFEKVDFDTPADVYVINTCSVTDQADKKCRKVIRQARKNNPDAMVVVIGCYAQLKPDEIVEIDGVDLVLGAKEKFDVLEHISVFDKKFGSKAIASGIDEANTFHDAWSVNDRTRTFLKIQDGCDYKCTFCTIPLARGKSRSDKLENIIRNANSIAAEGIREIVLTGVNIGDYGKDQPHDFLDVIRELDRVDGIDRFRISSIEPNLLNEDIIAFVASSAKFMPHFHIPLQSGSDTMLAAMRRRYKSSLYSERVAEIRRLIPHAAIGVDVIVGFPGETEALFRETFDFLHQLDVSYFHVFSYSERTDTLAAAMENQVPLRERYHRSKILRELSDKKKNHFYRQFTGHIRPVLFESENKDGMMYGFTDNYIKVQAPFNSALANEIVPVRIGKPDGQGHVEALEQFHSVAS